MAVDKISARERLIQRHGVYIVDDWKLAELALNSLMDELDQNDTGLSAEQAMKVALAEVKNQKHRKDSPLGRNGDIHKGSQLLKTSVFEQTFIKLQLTLN